MLLLVFVETDPDILSPQVLLEYVCGLKICVVRFPSDRPSIRPQQDPGIELNFFGIYLINENHDFKDF